MNELSLFSGVGGGLLGTLLLGWRPIGLVENNKYCQQVLAQRMADGVLPVAPIFTDMRLFLESGAAAAYRGFADVVTAGWPCQPHSTAGKRRGTADPREGWPYVIETIRQARPPWFLGENVPGLLSTDAGRYFAGIQRDLAQAGYDCRWRILSAAEMGAPHKRDRLWLVAYDTSQRTWQLPIRQGRPRQASTDADRLGQDVADANSGCSQRAEHQVCTGRHIAELGGQDALDVAHTASEQGGRIQQSSFPSDAGTNGQVLANADSARRYQSGAIGSDAEHALAESRSDRGQWWAAEPRLGRLAYGVPNRVDRLRAAGNGQVPAVVAAAWLLLTEDLICSGTS